MDIRRPLHVGMVTSYDLCEPGGGVKTHALQLAQALRALGDRVTVFGPAEHAIDEPDLRGFPGVVNIFSNGSHNRVGIFASPFALWRLLHQMHFDVLHIHEPLTPTLPYYAAWLSPGVPKIATFHAYAEQSPPGLLAARRIFAPLILPWIDRGIAVSEPAVAHARINWNGPLDVIPNGIATAAFPPGPPPRSDRPLRLLFVGLTTDARKGFHYLLEAVERARAAGVAVELHVVGEFPPSDNAPPTHVVHHGPLDDHGLAEQYRECDVFVAPSTGQESFGIVLLEAMSAARAIICTDIYGYRNTANPAGARWVPPGDTHALLRAILELAANPNERRRMGEANARYVRRFDWSVVAPKIRTAYLRAIAHAGGTRVLAPQTDDSFALAHSRGGR